MGLRDKRLWLVVAAVSFTMLMALLVVSWRVLPAEFDLAQAIRDREDWLMKTPISYENATQILGGNSPGGRQFGDVLGRSSSGFNFLNNTYYSYCMLPFTPDPHDFLEVVQIWYRDDGPYPAYIVVRQSSAEEYLKNRPLPEDKYGFFPRPHFTVRLDDGTPVGIVFAHLSVDGVPFAEPWVRHKWHFSWISRGIRHYAVGINIHACEVMEVIADISHQPVNAMP